MIKALDAKEFITEIERIKTRWPGDYYSADRMDLMFREFKEVELDVFNYICLEFLTKNPVMTPMIPDFRRALSDFKVSGKVVPNKNTGSNCVTNIAKRNESSFPEVISASREEINETYGEWKTKPKKAYECSHCRESGIVYATLLEDKEQIYSTMFKCFCLYGKAKKGNWPVWSIALELKYKALPTD